MEASRWQQIHDTFQRALACSHSERAAFLDEIYGRDVELHWEVTSLLATEPTGRFDELAERFGGLTPDSAVPERVGSYTIMREIGQGGMSTVYLAERADGAFEQRVALKLWSPGSQRRDLYRRFLAERQILARLQHEHIARLLDGGIADNGAPYFVMEYVDGAPITEHCNTGDLDVDARLSLFLDVCSAVQYAHRNLVVHRDLKPSNVLVTQEGVVKLLDFGIAKLLAETDSLPLTRTGLSLMTPEYAAPEQVRGEPVTTATDVYGLGLLLYELLTGRRPYTLSGQMLSDMERVICQEDPEKPSMAIAAGRRPGTVRRDRIRRRLAGDLDTIVLTAMRKEPERRYPSTEALGEDLRRHLDGLPVRARPDTLVYRATKFARRHRFGVGATVVGLVLVGAFVIALSQQAREIAVERDRAENAAAFMVELFEDFEPVQAQGSTVTTRDLLDRRVARIRSSLNDQPLLRARLLDALGQVYQLRGHFAEAESLLRESLALRQTLQGSDHLDVAASLYHLGALLNEKDTHAEAESLLYEALSVYRRELDREDPRTTYVLDELATVHRARGDLDGAEAMYREMLQTYGSTSAADIDRAIALLFLGKVLMEKGSYVDAEAPLRESLAIRRRLFGEDHPSVANSLDGLGELMQAKGDLVSAEHIYIDALAIRRRLFEEGHPDLAASLVNLGSVLHQQQRNADAEPFLREALAIARPAFGEQHILVLDALTYLGAVRAARNDQVGADSQLSAALDIWQRRWPGVANSARARTMYELGLVRFDQGDTKAADTLLRQALSIRRETLPEGHPDIEENLVSLNRIRAAQRVVREGSNRGDGR